MHAILIEALSRRLGDLKFEMASSKNEPLCHFEDEAPPSPLPNVAMQKFGLYKTQSYTTHVLGLILALPDDFNESVQLIAVSCLLTVQNILEALPNWLTVDIREQLRISKQTLVELSSRAGVLRQMLFNLPEDPHEIRRICIMGRNCTLKKGNEEVECCVPLEKQIADEEEEEIEMLLEKYLQRCESCHGQAERLLDSAKEMEDSIAVNLRL